MSETFKSRYDLYYQAKKFEADGRYKEALDAYTKVLETTGDHILSWFYMTKLHYKLHNYQKAKKCAEKTLKLSPSWERSLRPIIDNCRKQLKS
jgi:tetratricopeptide (TPR) repeat protein